MIRSAKKEFFSRSIAKNKDNAYLWKHIKNLKEPQTSNKLPDELHLDGQVYNNIKNVAENLNYFFSTIRDKLKSEYPTNNITCDLIKSEMRSFKSNENIHKKEGGSYYVVSANKASSVTL